MDRTPAGVPALSTTGVWRDEALILDRPDDGDRSDDLRLTETHLEQITAAFTRGNL